MPDNTEKIVVETAEDGIEGFVGPIQAEWGEYRSIKIIHPEQQAQLERQRLISDARRDIDTQELRAREFEKLYETLSGKKVRNLDPVGIDWFRKRLKMWMYSTCLPGWTPGLFGPPGKGIYSGKDRKP